jgi:peptide/nickel transport system substrate-binding protein
VIVALSLAIAPAEGAPKSRAAAASTSKPPAPVETGPQGRVTFATTLLLPIMLDPAETVGPSPFIIHYALHDALVRPMPGRPMAASLAESWTVSADGKVYEFTLRPGLRFHNGDPMTATDVKFSFERYRGDSSLLLRSKVARVQVVDGRRVRFHLKNPWPDFMTFYGTSATSAAWIVPKRYVERVGDEGFRKHPIGAGPYKFVSHTPGVLTLEAWDGYWRTTPNIKTLGIVAMSDDARRLTALRRREVDVAHRLTPRVAQQLKRTRGLTLVASSQPSTVWLLFAEQWDRKSPWYDRRVRLAANHAINRQAINETVYLGLGRPTASFIPAGMEYFWDPPAYAYDPDRARQLLKEAGYPNGFDAGELMGDMTYGRAIGEPVAADLQAVGIRAPLRLRERVSFFKEKVERKLKALVLTQSGEPGHVATRLEQYAVSGGYFTYSTYQDIDGLFTEQAGEADLATRQQILTKMQQLIHERAMFAPIIEPVMLNGVGPRVEVHGLGLIANYPWVAPYEEVKLRGK